MPLENIAVNGFAFQSSLSRWSKSEDEANNALSGIATDGYAFHTNNECSAWWVVDLKKVFPIDFIRIYLRNGFESRNEKLEIYISDNLSEWRNLGHGKLVKADILETYLENQTGRFIKLVVNNNYLHLRKVEVYSDTDIINFRGVMLKDNNIISRNVVDVIKRQTYEAAEINCALTNASSQDTILELGACVGAVSSVIIKNINPKKYFAIEANPYLINIIQTNHNLNNITCSVINAAVGLQEGTMDFYIHNETWRSSLVPFKNPVKIEKN